MEDKNRNNEQEQQVRHGNELVDINSTISIVNLNVNAVSISIKRQIDRIDKNEI